MIPQANWPENREEVEKVLSRPLESDGIEDKLEDSKKFTRNNGPLRDEAFQVLPSSNTDGRYVTPEEDSRLLRKIDRR